MRALFYRVLDYDSEPELVGAVELGVNGKAVPSNDTILELVDEVSVVERGTLQELTFEDGDRYILALQDAFRSPYFYAEVDPLAP